jgi:hypothetical protein
MAGYVDVIKQKHKQKWKTLIIFRSEIAHALLRVGKTTAKEKGRSSSDSPTPELVNKKNVRNSAKVVDDVRYDCVGQWPAHIEKKAKVQTIY